jgi:hypothetical protein
MTSKNADSGRRRRARARARGEVEAEAVDVALGDPVAQGVHDQPQDARVHGVERVARAREVHVEGRVLGHEPVVALVVDALNDSVGPRWLPSAVWL